MDPYKILGVDPQASLEEIKRAYRRMSAKYHPDRGGDSWVFQQILKAYEELCGESETAPPNSRTSNEDSFAARNSADSNRSQSGDDFKDPGPQIKRPFLIDLTLLSVSAFLLTWVVFWWNHSGNRSKQTADSRDIGLAEQSLPDPIREKATHASVHENLKSSTFSEPPLRQPSPSDLAQRTEVPSVSPVPSPNASEKPTANLGDPNIDSFNQPLRNPDLAQADGKETEAAPPADPKPTEDLQEAPGSWSLPGSYQVEMTDEQTGKKSIHLYQFEMTGEVLRNHEPWGTWKATNGKLILTFNNRNRGHVDIVMTDADHFTGTHFWRLQIPERQTTKWIGTRQVIVLPPASPTGK